MKLLDTTFLVDYERGEEAVAEYLEANEAAEFVTGNSAEAHGFSRPQNTSRSGVPVRNL